MKSILIFLAGMIVGMLVLWQTLTLIDKFKEYKKAKLEPVLMQIDFAGCGDQHEVKQ